MMRFKAMFKINALLTAILAFWVWAIALTRIPYWFCLLAAASAVWGYDVLAGAFFWVRDREEREAEIAAQTAIIDRNWRMIEVNHGVKGLERAVTLAIKELRFGLTRDEADELAFLCAETTKIRRAAE